MRAGQATAARSCWTAVPLGPTRRTRTRRGARSPAPIAGVRYRFRVRRRTGARRRLPTPDRRAMDIRWVAWRRFLRSREGAVDRAALRRCAPARRHLGAAPHPSGYARSRAGAAVEDDEVRVSGHRPRHRPRRVPRGRPFAEQGTHQPRIVGSFGFAATALARLRRRPPKGERAGP